MNCPLCGKPAKTARGLTTHLKGTKPYGGHELSDADAAAQVGIAQGHATAATARRPVIRKGCGSFGSAKSLVVTRRCEREG